MISIDFLQMGLTVLASWFVLLVVLSWMMALLYPLCRQALKHLPIYTRSFSYLVYCLVPVLTATFTLGFYAFPEAIAPLISSHCHDVNCSPHRPYTPISAPLGGGTLLLIIIVMLAFGLWLLRQLLVSHRYLQALSALSSTVTPSSTAPDASTSQWARVKKNLPSNLLSKEQPSFKEIPTSHPIAWCAGLWQPQVFISRKLRESLSPEQLVMLLAHEYAHASRKDGLRKWLLNIATHVWPTAIKGTFRQRFNNDIEIIADLTAMGDQPSVEQERWIHQAAMHCCSMMPNDTTPRAEPRDNTLGHQEHASSAHWQATENRVEELKKQRQLLCPTHRRRRLGKAIAICGLLFTLWLIVTLGLMVVGHPLIEWVFQ